MGPSLSPPVLIVNVTSGSAFIRISKEAQCLLPLTTFPSRDGREQSCPPRITDATEAEQFMESTNAF